MTDNPLQTEAPDAHSARPAASVACLCSHTHWDREWYGSFQQFRFRLVRLVDRLMALLESDPDFRCFNLDGQTIVLEDYLEVKPAERERLVALIRAGRIAIGPWYILPDEWLVSGEATIRNLLRGRMICREFGIEPPRVGYLPDMFGHVSQMPQLLRGFGIDNAIFWRGLSGDEWMSELWWDAPDGSRVLGFHLPEYCGYCNAAFFFASLPPEIRDTMPADTAWGDLATGDMELTMRALRAVVDRAAARSRSGVLLLMNGVDHMEANPLIPEVIRRASAEIPGLDVRHATFAEFVDALRAACPDDLQVVRGERRDTARAPHSGSMVLPNILSSRVHLKLSNARSQHLLEKWAEPFACAASMLGGEAHEGLIRTAWKWLLRNHPHDSIGGCSTDAVHRQMETRTEWCDEIADTVTGASLHTIANATDTSALAPDELAWLLFNPLGHGVTDLVRTHIDVDERWLKARGLDVNPENILRTIRGLELMEWDGSPVDADVEDVEYLTQHWPWAGSFAALWQVVRFHVAVRASRIPALGFRAYRLRVPRRPNRMPLRPRNNLPARLCNAHLTVDIRPDGTLTIGGPALEGRQLRGAHHIECGGDNGDGYTYSPPRFDTVQTTLGGPARITRLADGAAHQAVAVDYEMRVPAGLTADWQHRDTATVPLRIRSVFRLGADSTRIDVETTLTNTARDHRLRVCFPVPDAGDSHVAESQFDIIRRPNAVTQPPAAHWIEDQPYELPVHGFVNLGNLAVAGPGLHEYEVVAGEPSMLKLTLMRAAAFLGAAGHPNTIAGGAGPHMATPEQQMIGRTLTFRYAIIPHGGDWRRADVRDQGERHAVLWRGVVTDAHAGALPPGGHSFVHLEGDVVVSAVKQVEDTPGHHVLRVWNPGDETVTIRTGLAAGVAAAWLSDLNEDMVAELPLDADRRVRVSVDPKRIVTIRFATNTPESAP